MACQDCSTCRYWDNCKGQMRVGVECYAPTKEEIIRQELIKNERLLSEFSNMLNASIPYISRIAKIIVEELPNAVKKAEEFDIKREG